MADSLSKNFIFFFPGSNSTREALHATEQGFAVGMHAALHINPYYGKTSMDGLARHFKAVLQEGPTMIYNVPGRTGQDIPDDVVHHLSDSPNFLGVKECTGTARIKVCTRELAVHHVSQLYEILAFLYHFCLLSAIEMSIMQACL